MSKKSSKLKHSDEDRAFAKYLAMAVRNEMEQFHVANLSNAQMREINRIIRNAIYTALFAARNSDKLDVANQFLEFNSQMIPDYWEEPEFADSFLRSIS